MSEPRATILCTIHTSNETVSQDSSSLVAIKTINQKSLNSWNKETTQMWHRNRSLATLTSQLICPLSIQCSQMPTMPWIKPLCRVGECQIALTDLAFRRICRREQTKPTGVRKLTNQLEKQESTLLERTLMQANIRIGCSKTKLVTIWSHRCLSLTMRTATSEQKQVMIFSRRSIELTCWWKSSALTSLVRQRICTKAAARSSLRWTCRMRVGRLIT